MLEVIVVENQATQDPVLPDDVVQAAHSFPVANATPLDPFLLKEEWWN